MQATDDRQGALVVGRPRSLYSRPLEKGAFKLPAVAPEGVTVCIASSNLAMVLDGIDWTFARPQELHEPAKPLVNFPSQKIDKRPEA